MKALNSGPILAPTSFPQKIQLDSPTNKPSDILDTTPASEPIKFPSDFYTQSSSIRLALLTLLPTFEPSSVLSTLVVDSLSVEPIGSPTELPTILPSSEPSASPSALVTVSPSSEPSASPTEFSFPLFPMISILTMEPTVEPTIGREGPGPKGKPPPKNKPPPKYKLRKGIF